MLCIKCKKEIPDGSAFCNHCGKKQVRDQARKRKRIHGTGSITKDTRNKAHPWIAHAPSSRFGKSRTYLGSFTTYKDAQEAIDKYIREGRPELYGATLGDVYRLWSETHFQTVSQSAVSLYTSMWKRFAELESIKMEDIKTAHFQQIIDTSTSKSAAETIRAMASMLCRYAMQNDIISKNYADFLKIPKFEKKEKRIFSPSEIELLWKHSDDDHVKPILFMIYTGLRIGELLQLNADCLHLDDGYIICGEKTEAGKNRVVPLPQAIPELSVWLREWSQKKKRWFPSTATGFRQVYFYPALESSGILEPGDHSITPHSCRHTFASICAESGMKPEQLQKIIGHAHFSTTADVYIHKDLDTLKAAMSKIKR